MKRLLYAVVFSVALYYNTMDPYSRAVWRSMGAKAIIAAGALVLWGLIELVRWLIP
ncbi:MAG: hypothetical protein KIT10_14495 [Flavobacteriales bacterium]|nr:hypothetical protein [Flavobacteriales bacterium]